MVEKTTWSDEQIFITIMWRVNWHHEPLMRCPETPASFLWFSCHNVWPESSHEEHCINPVEDHPTEWEARSFQDCQDHKKKKNKKRLRIVPESKRLRIHAVKFSVTSWMGFWTRKGKETSLLTESEIVMGPVLYQCWSSDVMGGLYVVMKESVFALWTFTLDI